jgi:hypothetical protein
MAKNTKGKSKRPPDDAVTTSVDENEQLVLSIKTLGRIEVNEGVVLERIHPSQFGATEFNRSGKGNSRFSPIYDENAKLIATIYAASEFEAAAMETAFHDVPLVPGEKNVTIDTINQLVHSTIEVKTELMVGDLTGLGLRRIGLAHADIVGSEPSTYPHTRRVAELIHKEHQDIQGIAWISKQHGSEKAYVFFEDRIADGAFEAIGDPKPLLEGDTLGKVLDLAEKINVNLVPGTTSAAPAAPTIDNPSVTDRRRKRRTPKAP